MIVIRVEIWSKNNVRLAVNSGEKKLFSPKAPTSFGVECGEFGKVFFTAFTEFLTKKTGVHGSKLSPPECQKLFSPLLHLPLTAMIFPLNSR